MSSLLMFILQRVCSPPLSTFGKGEIVFLHFTGEKLMATKTATDKSQDGVGDVATSRATSAARSSHSNGNGSSPPECTFRVGRVSASVFINTAQLKSNNGGGDYTRRFRTCTLQRSYKAEDGSTQYTSSFGLGEIRNAIRVLELAAMHLESKEAKVAD